MLGNSLNKPIHDGNCKGLVEIKNNGGLQSPKWEINKMTCGKIVKTFNKLPYYIKGIPNLNNSQAYNCFVFNETEAFILAFNSLIFGFKSNVIEIKIDRLDVIKNEILKTCPEDLYNIVIDLLSDFKTEKISSQHKSIL